MLVGCVHAKSIEGYHGSSIPPYSSPDPRVPSPDETARAFQLFEYRAPEVFDTTSEEMHAALENVTVVYHTNKILLPDGRTRTGATPDRRTIEIYIDDVRNTVGTNALVHELIHLAMWNLYDMPDNEHTSGAFGDWEQNVMLELRATSWRRPNLGIPPPVVCRYTWDDPT